MIALERITEANLAAFKAVRLRALREDPLAFGSTYARESQFSDAQWGQRLERWDGLRGIGLLAMRRGDACGIAGALIDENDSQCAELVSMWTAPEQRRHGVGRMLVEGVAAWAERSGALVIKLMVTSVNQQALAFYERLGFARTGEHGPYPNDPALEEWRMVRRLGGTDAVDTLKSSR